MDSYFTEVKGIRPSELKFPEPIPTIQYDRPIGPSRPTFVERLESEAPFIRVVTNAGGRAAEWARNHPVNTTPPNRGRSERQHNNRSDFGMSGFLPEGMNGGLTFEEMAYGPIDRQPPAKRSRRRKR